MKIKNKIVKIDTTKTEIIRSSFTEEYFEKAENLSDFFRCKKGKSILNKIKKR